MNDVERCIASMMKMKSRGGSRGVYKTFGRKVRCLKTGKWYLNIKQKNSAALRSAKAIARLDDELMRKFIKASHTPRAIGRRIATKELRYDPVREREIALQRHRDNPHMALMISKATKKQRIKQMTERGGVQVQKIVYCERTKSVGVSTI